MLRRVALLLSLTLLVVVSAQAQDRVQVFGGYSFEHYGTSPTFNTNGYEVSGQYKLLRWIGVFGDVDGHYGTLEGVSGSTHNFLVGPQVSFPAKVSPFAHVMFGGGRFNGGGVTSTSIAEGFGFGVDTKVAPAFSWRIVQIDIIHTHLFNDAQSSMRASTGIVFHF